METPSETLAKSISERLSAELLISPKQIEKLQKQIANGTARAEDWRMAIEIIAKKGTP